MARQLAVIALVVPTLVVAGSGPGSAADFCPPRTVSISDAGWSEGWAGSAVSLNFIVLTAGCAGGTVAYVTSPGGNGLAAASPGVDYVAVSGVLSWAPGDGGFRTISVPLLGDGAVEPDESLTVHLVDPSGLSVSDGTGFGTIVDDDPFKISLDFGADSRPFCLEICVTCWLRVVASSPAAANVTVRFATRNGTATAGTDYTAITEQKLTIPAGATEVRLPTGILDDKIAEPEEHFYVNIYAPSAGEIGTGTFAVTITDEDGTGPGGRLHGGR